MKHVLASAGWRWLFASWYAAGALGRFGCASQGGPWGRHAGEGVGCSLLAGPLHYLAGAQVAVVAGWPLQCGLTHVRPSTGRESPWTNILPADLTCRHQASLWSRHLERFACLVGVAGRQLGDRTSRGLLALEHAVCASLAFESRLPRSLWAGALRCGFVVDGRALWVHPDFAELKIGSAGHHRHLDRMAHEADHGRDQQRLRGGRF